MEELSLLVTFAVGLAGALVFGYIALRLKLSPIIGYLLAGIAVGPFTPGVVVNRSVAEQFAEIGVILLLFGIGMRFHLREFDRGMADSAARGTHLREAPALRRAGAALVAAGEAEVGVALAEAVTAADQMTCGDAAEHRDEIRRLYEGKGANLVT